MSTPLTDAITALTTYANEVTGGSDTTLSAAVGTLAAGYGSGGEWSSDGIALNTEPSGAITLSSSVTSIGNYAFYGKPVTSISGSGITIIGGNAFTGTRITSITDDNFPSITKASYFNSMESLRTIKLSHMASLAGGGYQLRWDTNLLTAEFPGVTSVVYMYCFGDCKKMKLCDVGYATSINTYAFSNCNALQTLILRRTGNICALANVMGFNNTPFRGYNSLTGTVYCPSDLISAYQSATNWSTLYANGTVAFVAIEGSAYEI